jgi:DNA-binding transcriptional regulator YiaG
MEEKNEVKEIWMEIRGYEGLYEVSNLGRVRKIYTSPSGEVDCRILSQAYSTQRYLQCSLSKRGVKKSHRIHRLVAENFIPNPKNKAQVNHIDGNKDNNYVNNLEWCTQHENMRHANKNWLINKVRVLDEDAVREIRENKNNLKQRELAEIYGVSAPQIHRVIHYKKWAHVK